MTDQRAQTPDQIVARLVQIITSHHNDYEELTEAEKGSDAATERDLSAYDAMFDVLMAAGRLNGMANLMSISLKKAEVNRG